jgi:hypothetical protein
MSLSDALFDGIAPTGLTNPYQQDPSSNFPSLPQVPQSFMKPGSQVITSTQQVATQSGLPYGCRYEQFAPYPTFPLYGTSDANAFAQKQQRKEVLQGRLRPEPTKGDKMVMQAMKLASGVNIDSARKIENNLTKLNVASTQMTIEQNKLLIFTRWALAPGTGPVTWFVDVLEWRAPKEGGANPTYLKMNGNESVKVLGKIVKGLKPGKTWSKNWNFNAVDEMVFVNTDKSEIPMTIVAREERAISAIEAHAVRKRFDKEWTVPRA